MIVEKILFFGGDTLMNSEYILARGLNDKCVQLSLPIINTR